MYQCKKTAYALQQTNYFDIHLVKLHDGQGSYYNASSSQITVIAYAASQGAILRFSYGVKTTRKYILK